LRKKKDRKNPVKAVCGLQNAADIQTVASIPGDRKGTVILTMAKGEERSRAKFFQKQNKGTLNKRNDQKWVIHRRKVRKAKTLVHHGKRSHREEEKAITVGRSR